LKNEHDKLKRELDDAKREVEAAIRNHYHLREQAINHNASLLAEKDKALHQLQTAQTNLKAGLATQFDVDQGVLAITHIEFELLKNEYVLWLQQFMYEHPFLLM
jgi:outer membrane protein TolC